MQIKQITIAANLATDDAVIRRVLSENMPFLVSDLKWQPITRLKQSGYEQGACDINGMRVVLTRLIDQISLVSLTCTAYGELGAKSLLTILGDLVNRSFKPAEADGVWVKAFDSFGQPLVAQMQSDHPFTLRLRDFRHHGGKLYYVVNQTHVNRHREPEFPLSWEEFKTVLTTDFWVGMLAPNHWLDLAQPNASLLTDVLELTRGGLWEFGHFQKVFNPNAGVDEAINSTSLLQTATGEHLESLSAQDALAIVTRYDIWECPFWALVFNGLLMGHLQHGSMIITKEADSTGISVTKLISEVEQHLIS